MIPIRAPEAIRTRFELAGSPEGCTGPHCRAVSDEVLVTATAAAMPALGLGTTSRHTSPHAPTTRLVVRWADATCEIHDGRTEGVTDPARLDAAVGRLREIWVEAAPVTP
ncbi:MAG: hypothetical protein H6737_26110 [Alphaproteobacteria bacterium]|nr:hypothetical protein [Alphaproteobacteria bacterium]